MLPFSEQDLDRLGKLLGMLGSDADAERALAGAKADALVRERGSSWSEIIDHLRALRAPVNRTHRDDARECLELVGVWTAKELSFLFNLARRRKAPTADQAEWLARLLDEARIFAREAA